MSGSIKTEGMLIGALPRVPAQAIQRRIISELNAAGFEEVRVPHMAVLQFPGAGPEGAMRFFYELAYRIGFNPWEKAATHPAASLIHTLFNREAQRLPAPLGRALDVGCGNGHWSVELARRGWDVVGIDVVATAVRQARRLVAQTDVNAKIVRGDITRLREAGVGTDFRLVWDFGTIHGLTPEQRAATGSEINAVTTRDAIILLMAWTPGRRGPLPQGMNRDDLLSMLPGWHITDEEPFDASGLARPLRNVGPRLYRLERHG